MSERPLTIRQAAGYLQMHPDTVQRLCRDYERSKGKRGIRSVQPRPHACRRIYVADLDRYLTGEPTTKRPKFRVAS